jgi:hypothetical protein
MPSNRCFDLLGDSHSDASDYIRGKKQKTIYSELVHNSSTPNIGPNPVKKNGYKYNMNFGISEPVCPGAPDPECVGGCLKFAKSYELLLDVTKGKFLGNPVMSDANAHEGQMWSGNAITVSYGSYPVVDTSFGAGDFNQVLFPIDYCNVDCSWSGQWPGVIIDPCYQIFNDQKGNACEAEKGIPLWLRNTGVTTPLTRSSNYYWKMVNSQPLRGMRYPGPVKFTHQSSSMVGPFAPRPQSDVSYVFGPVPGGIPSGGIVTPVPTCHIATGAGRQKSAIS